MGNKEFDEKDQEIAFEKCVQSVSKVYKARPH
jgi:hypothetical protein